MKKLSLEAIPTSLRGTLGLCYFDPVSERLVEFNSEEKIYLTPFENSVRRYYLVLTNPIYNGTRLQYATIHVSTEYDDISVKVLEGLEVVNDRYNYEDIEANNTITVFFNNYASGIVPLDINTKSFTSKNVKFTISIDITAG